MSTWLTWLPALWMRLKIEFASSGLAGRAGSTADVPGAAWAWADLEIGQRQAAGRGNKRVGIIWVSFRQFRVSRCKNKEIRPPSRMEQLSVILAPAPGDHVCCGPELIGMGAATCYGLGSEHWSSHYGLGRNYPIVCPCVRILAACHHRMCGNQLRSDMEQS